MNWVTVGLDGIDRGDDVGAAAAGFGVVVGEDGGDVGERHAVEMVVREELIGVAERDLAAADGLAALGEDRTEAPGRSHERAGGRVEVIGEARRRRGSGTVASWLVSATFIEPELRLERAVEVRRMIGAVELHVVAVQHQAARPEDVFEQRRQRCRAILRLRERGLRVLPVPPTSRLQLQ